MNIHAFLLHVIRVLLSYLSPWASARMSLCTQRPFIPHTIEWQDPGHKVHFTLLFSFLLTETIWVLECGVFQHTVLLLGFCSLCRDHTWVHGSGCLVLITEGSGSSPSQKLQGRNSFLPFTARELRLQEKWSNYSEISVVNHRVNMTPELVFTSPYLVPDSVTFLSPRTCWGKGCSLVIKQIVCTKKSILIG